MTATIVPGSLEAAVFGTTDPAIVADRIGEVARAGTGATVTGLRWYVRSVACVAGAVLDDGREVVVRAYQPSVTEAFLDGVIRVQRHVAGAGFPAAEPLSGPIRTTWGLGRVESVLPDAGMARLPPESMVVSAHGLAEVATLLAEVDRRGLDEHPMLRLDGLYPPPHSTLFDFAATAEGAEWIDAIAADALGVLDAEDAPIALAHTDWSGRNIRVDGGALIAVFDWESVAATTEARSVGVATATWRSTGEPDDPIAPDADELAAYIDLYAEVRPLSAEQRRIAIAKAVHGMAYTARCEHSLLPHIRATRATARLPDLAPLVRSG